MTDILAEIRKAQARLAELPPAPVFMSSVHFPADNFVTLKIDGVEHVCGSPKLWAMVPKAPLGSIPNPLTSLEVIDLDLSSNRGRLEAICARIVKAIP